MRAHSTTRNQRAIALFGLALFAFAGSGCGSGFTRAPNPNSALDAFDANTVSQGFIPDGFTGTETQPAVTAARITTSEGDKKFTFVAFRGTSGSSNIYVSPVTDLAPHGFPTAFDLALAPEFENPRCQNCHGFPSTLPFADPVSTFPHGSDPSIDCTPCHGELETEVEFWTTPQRFTELAAAGVDLDFRGKSSTDIVTNIALWEAVRRANDQEFTITEHFEHDTRVRWALDVGRVPLQGVTRTTSPLSFESFNGLIRAWDEAGRPLDTTGAVPTGGTVLASRAPGTGATLNSSSNPSIAFVPVDPPVGTTVGRLHIAFTASLQIYVAEVRVDVTGTTPSLTWESTTLVSAAFGGGTSNGSSGRPEISGDGTKIVFHSTGTNLVAGFVDANGPGSPDVFLWESGTVRLVSGMGGSSTTSGNGSSLNGSIDPGGLAVAYASAASDLGSAGGDMNSAEDIYYRKLPLSTASNIRASVRPGGGEAGGGNCTNPTIAVREGIVMVAFESTFTNLVDAPLNASRNIYLFDNADGPTTLLITRNASTQGANNDAFSPALSENGLSLAFDSTASDLVTGPLMPPAGTGSVYRVPLANYFNDGRVFQIDVGSVGFSGAPGEGGASHTPTFGSISNGSGRVEEVMVYQTAATNLGVEAESDFMIAFPEALHSPECVIQVGTGGAEILTPLYAAEVGNPVHFSIRKLEDVVATRWDFGDGTIGFGREVTHTFNSLGTYTVELEATNSAGITTICDVMVQTQSTNVAPVAFAGGPYTGFAGSPILLDGSASFDPDGSSLTYRWVVSGTTIGALTGALTTATISAPGTYLVTMEVTDIFGATTTDTATATIAPNALPIATVNPATVSATAGQTVNFTSTVTDENPGTVAYFWTVSNGTIVGSASGTSVNVQLTTPGSITITLTTTDERGAPSTSTATASVTGGFSPVHDVLVANCDGGSCHSSLSPDIDDEAQAYNTLTTGSSGSCGTPYVVAGNSGSSLLFLVLDNSIAPCANSFIMGSGLTNDEKGIIQAWIDNGANP